MMTQQPFFTTLKGRDLIKISGIERKSFLQGLITNDIRLLDHQDCVYACLLTPQGKFLFDFFISEHADAILLDCEGGERTTALIKLLNMYKLRSDISISSEKNSDVYAVIGANIGHKDPRHPEMGYRSFTKPENMDEKRFEDWDYRRIALSIPDGSRDMIPGKSTMDEVRMDTINGISYEKGCYVGQELTARVHYRGLGKKHLYTIKSSDIAHNGFPQNGSSIEHDGKVIGEMRSSSRNIGIALLKDEFMQE